MVLAIAAVLFHMAAPVRVLCAVREPLSAESRDCGLTASARNRPDAAPPANTPGPLASQGEVIPAASSVPVAVDPASFASAIRNSDSLATLRISEPESSKPLRFVSPESLPSRREWIALSILQHAAATFDAYSTRQAMSQGAVESDPLMRPFAHSSAMYAVIQVAPVVLDLAARRMQRSQSNILRLSWWLPQTMATGMFVVSGVHNLHVASQLQ
jgi:hypothetical protein